jgi:hypothetical protein
MQLNSRRGKWQDLLGGESRVGRARGAGPMEVIPPRRAPGMHRL